MNPLIIVAALAVIVASGSKPRKATAPPCPVLNDDGGTVNGIRYAETVVGTDDARAKMPMLIIFHSRGAAPSAVGKSLDLNGNVRVIRPYGFNRTDGGGYSWFSRSLKENPEEISLELRESAGIIAAFIKTLARCRPTMGKPIVAGYSEGGHVSYLMASTAPGLVGGAVAALGYIPPQLWNAKMAPTIGLHNTADATVPFERTNAYWTAMKKSGARLQTKTFPGGHSMDGDIGPTWEYAINDMISRQIK